MVSSSWRAGAQLCALAAAAVIVGAPAAGFPPAATGSCKGPTDCMACVDTSCKAEAGVCAQSDSCSASAACLMSTIQDHHVADTPTDCQSLDCVAPCFAANSTAEAVAYLACAAKCLPQTVVAPGEHGCLQTRLLTGLRFHTDLRCVQASRSRSTSPLPGRPTPSP